MCQRDHVGMLSTGHHASHAISTGRVSVVREMLQIVQSKLTLRAKEPNPDRESSRNRWVLPELPRDDQTSRDVAGLQEWWIISTMMTFLLRSWFRNFDQRFSAIFSDFQNRWKSLNENRCWKLDFFAWNTKHRDIGDWTVSHFFPTPRRFVWQNSAKRWHFFCSKVANYDIFRKSLRIAENLLKIAEIRSVRRNR